MYDYPWRPEALDTPRAIVTEGCELPSLDAGNQTQYMFLTPELSLPPLFTSISHLYRCPCAGCGFCLVVLCLSRKGALVFPVEQDLC